MFSPERLAIESASYTAGCLGHMDDSHCSPSPGRISPGGPLLSFLSCLLLAIWLAYLFICIQVELDVRTQGFLITEYILLCVWNISLKCHWACVRHQTQRRKCWDLCGEVVLRKRRHGGEEEFYFYYICFSSFPAVGFELRAPGLPDRWCTTFGHSNSSVSVLGIF
jgi:hypothetical protein